jgi:hypothetical protein
MNLPCDVLSYLNGWFIERDVTVATLALLDRESTTTNVVLGRLLLPVFRFCLLGFYTRKIVQEDRLWAGVSGMEGLS